MCCDCDHCAGPTCESIVFGGKQICTVADAIEVFGADGIVWERWDGDRTCEHSPRIGYGPHKPSPTDCLCLVDTIATARLAGCDYHWLENDEPFFWSSITPRAQAQQTRPKFWGTICGAAGVALGFILCLWLIEILIYIDRKTEPQETVRYEMAAGRFGVAKPKRDVSTPILRLICPSLLNCAGSDLIDRSPEL